jgi:capsular polysaccharide biosynthesis protein
LEYTIDFIRILRRLLKKSWLIILVTVLAGMLGIVMTLGGTPNIYGAKVSLYSVASGSYTASIQGFDAMKDYAEIVGSKKVADRVINALPDSNLDAQMIQSMVRTSYGENSAIFYVYASSTDPQLAAAVANAVAEAFVLEVSNITGKDSVKILDEADDVFISYNGKSDQLKKRLIYAAVGFFLVCGSISLAEIFSTKVKEVNDCTLNGEIKLFGVIPKHDI